MLRLHDRLVDPRLAVLGCMGKLERVLEFRDIVGGAGESRQPSCEAVDGDRDMLADFLEDAFADRMDIQQALAHDAVADVDEENDLYGHGTTARRVLSRAGRTLDKGDLLPFAVFEQLERLLSEAAYGRLLLVHMQGDDHQTRLGGDDKSSVFDLTERLAFWRLGKQERCCQQETHDESAGHSRHESSSTWARWVPASRGLASLGPEWAHRRRVRLALLARFRVSHRIRPPEHTGKRARVLRQVYTRALV